jgi:hypothetical protein
VSCIDGQIGGGCGGPCIAGVDFDEGMQLFIMARNALEQQLDEFLGAGW